MILSFLTFCLNSSSTHIQSINQFAMKKKNNLIIYLLFICTVLLLTSCDKIPSGIVDFKTVDYAEKIISIPSSVVYAKSDSSVVTSIQIINTASVGSVWCKISSLDGTIIIKDKSLMYDDGNTAVDGDLKKGDGIYSGKFYMSKLNPNGKYQIDYYVEDNINLAPDNLSKVGSAQFNFDNGQNNLPPVISNLVLPASVNRGDSFIFSIKAEDPNGYADISQVYFRLYRPDGTLVSSGDAFGYFVMVDNGDQNLGDQTAGDGIYSFKNSFGTTAPIGSWKFEFQAKDRAGKLSEIITQMMTVN
jgi:hypothetical protein